MTWCADKRRNNFLNWWTKSVKCHFWFVQIESSCGEKWREVMIFRNFGEICWFEQREFALLIRNNDGWWKESIWKILKMSVRGFEQQVSSLHLTIWTKYQENLPKETIHTVVCSRQKTVSDEFKTQCSNSAKYLKNNFSFGTEKSVRTMQNNASFGSEKFVQSLKKRNDVIYSTKNSSDPVRIHIVHIRQSHIKTYQNTSKRIKTQIIYCTVSYQNSEKIQRTGHVSLSKLRRLVEIEQHNRSFRLLPAWHIELSLDSRR